MAKKKRRGSLLFVPLRTLLPALLVILALLMDTTILPIFYQGIYAPNFTMALVLAYTVRRSTMMGLAYGVAAGLLLDISTSYPVGMYTGTFLLAAMVASMCVFFERNTGRVIVLTIIYLLQELVFLAFAYASTIRLEWMYLVPLVIRVAISVVLCMLLQMFVGRYLRNNDITKTKSRRD